MIDKSKLVCITPFKYTEVFDKEQFLCCPGWLKEDIYQSPNIKDNFNSPKAQKIRQSILDGTYKYCDENQCPHLSALKQSKFIDKRFVPKTKEVLNELKLISEIETVNFCFDRSCNLKCPSCRLDFINYLGKDRVEVDNKLAQVNNELSDNIKRLYLSGSADPFYSKSFRQFLIEFDSSKYPKMKGIHLHTNGLLWTPKLWEKMKNIHKFVKSCEISIDASTKNTYENITRLGGNWETLLERLQYIVTIPTIKEYTFSFVVQDTNYTEMYGFYKIISNLTQDTGKKITIFFNHITNWGTYTEKQYLEKDISNPKHNKHSDFLKELEKIHGKNNVTHNFNQLLESKIKII